MNHPESTPLYVGNKQVVDRYVDGWDENAKLCLKVE